MTCIDYVDILLESMGFMDGIALFRAIWEEECY